MSPTGNPASPASHVIVYSPGLHRLNGVHYIHCLTGGTTPRRREAPRPSGRGWRQYQDKTAHTQGSKRSTCLTMGIPQPRGSWDSAALKLGRSATDFPLQPPGPTLLATGSLALAVDTLPDVGSKKTAMNADCPGATSGHSGVSARSLRGCPSHPHLARRHGAGSTRVMRPGMHRARSGTRPTSGTRGSGDGRSHAL